METLFRSLMKSAKQFQETSLEGLVYRVNDGMDMLGTLAYMLDIMMLASPRVSNWWGTAMSILSGMLPAFFSVYTNWADLSVPPDIILRFIMPMLFSPKANALSGYTPLRCNRNAPSFSRPDTDLYKEKEPIVPESRGCRNRLYLYSILGRDRLRLLHHPSL